MKITYHETVKNKKQGGKMKEISYLFLTFFLFSVTHSSVTAISADFFKRGLKHCTNYCDNSSIKCLKGIGLQGHYDWCKKKCAYETKTNREKFVSALDKCDEKEQKRWESYTSGKCPSGEDLTKLIWDSSTEVDMAQYGEDAFSANLPDGVALESFTYINQPYTSASWYQIYLSIQGNKNVFLEPEQKDKVCIYKTTNNQMMKLKLK